MTPPTRARTPKDAVQLGRQRAVSALLAAEVVREVAVILGAEGIDVMPMKGVLYQLWLYAGERSRALSDADVLVPRALHARAVEALVKHGFSVIERTRSAAQVTLRAPNGFDLDLHARLFPEGRYAMDGDDVLARGERNAVLFGEPVLVPAPVDAFVYAVGKFAADHADGRDDRALEDLARLAQTFLLSPNITAARLVDCGMTRAARYTLGIFAAARGNAFAQAVLSALPPDRLGDAVAGAARLWVEHLPPKSRWGAVASHGLHDSLPRGLAMGARAAARRVRPQKS